MQNYILFHKYFTAYKIASEMKSGLTLDKRPMVQDFGVSGDSFIEDIERCLPASHIFRVDDKVKKLLALTKVPKMNDTVPLPFPIMFIDVNFERQELAKLGIPINYKAITGILIREGVMIADNQKEVGKDLRITCSSLQDNGEIWFDTFNCNVNLNDEWKDCNLKVETCDSLDKDTKSFMHRFVLAFLNFVNNPEVEIVDSSLSKEQNTKRVKNKKVWIPLMSSVNVTGTVKRYINQLGAKGEFETNYRYWVRGFFRTLRDERYGKNVGKRIWICPYVRGSGVLIEKEYCLK